MKLRGLKTDADWLDRSIGLPTPEEAMKLSISPSDRVCRFHRLRRADGVPLAIEHAVVPARFLDDPQCGAAVALCGAGCSAASSRCGPCSVCTPRPSPPRKQSCWTCRTASPALFIERISYLPDGRTVEYTQSHYRGDTYDFVAELSLAPEVRP